MIVCIKNIININIYQLRLFTTSFQNIVSFDIYKFTITKAIFIYVEKKGKHSNIGSDMCQQNITLLTK